jgi:hypothetical protein
LIHKSRSNLVNCYMSPSCHRYYKGDLIEALDISFAAAISLLTSRVLRLLRDCISLLL